MSVRVSLVDDHALIRRGLREALSEDPQISVVAEAGDYAGWREISRLHPCDVLILDISLPGRSGIDILSTISELEQPPRVLVLSQYTEDQYGIRALKAGAMAYLNKTAAPEIIIEAVKTIAAGRKYVTDEIAEALMDNLSEQQQGHDHDMLSEREMQTMLLIAQGIKPAAIAEQFMLSTKTISVYRSRIKEKLGLSSNAEIAAYALRHGLIE